MTYPLGGNAGWEELDAVTDDPPVSHILPVPLIADYFDPAPLHGAGGVRPAVVYEIGASTVVVRGSLEARFTHPEVWGVALLDSIGVFSGNCSLTLTVYDDDRETVLWEVGTDALHAHPYLVNPDNYGSQEVDFAQGGASLGTVSVEVIDKAQIAGDQDSGWMTGKLAAFGFANVQGKRCVLKRFINEDLGYQVIIDGPAGNPSMGATYASYVFEIRDTRETERKVRLFEFAGSAATGLRSLVPDELVDGYGYDGATDTYLQRPGIPLQGHSNRAVGYPTPAIVTVSIGASEFPDQLRRLLIWNDAYQGVIDGIGRPMGLRFPNPDFVFQWRLSGSGDPWTEVPGSALGVSLNTSKSTVTEGARVVGQVTIEDRRVNPLDEMYDPLVVPLPAENDIIDFYLLGTVPTSEQHPVVLDSKLVPGVLGPYNATGALMYGRFNLALSSGGFSSGLIDLLADPGIDESLRRQTVPVYNRLGNLSPVHDIFLPARGLFSWRAAGSGDPWVNILLQPALPFGASTLAYLETPLRETVRVFTLVQLAAADADVPATGTAIEFTVTYQPGDPELLDLTVGLTTGELAKNVYDGLYAPRDVDGNLVPMRVIYDPAALLAMTDPVRMRLTEPVDDARDWLEKMVYAPTGWVPALDSLGRISPMSQVTPTHVAHLPAIVNAITEASPDWDAGQHIVNVVRLNYNRDYVYPDDDPNAYPDPVVSGGDPARQRQKVVGTQSVQLEESDQASIDRMGEQVLELDGSLFTAIGVIPDDAAELTLTPNPFASRRKIFVPGIFGGGHFLFLKPITSTPLVRSAVRVEPISGAIEDETGYQQFFARWTYLLPRYKLGAPTVSVNVRRSALLTLRAGSWVVLDLTWFPDYITERRGLITLAQIISLGDIDCAWRHVLAEVVIPVEAASG